MQGGRIPPVCPGDRSRQPKTFVYQISRRSDSWMPLLHASAATTLDLNPSISTPAGRNRTVPASAPSSWAERQILRGHDRRSLRVPPRRCHGPHTRNSTPGWCPRIPGVGRTVPRHRRTVTHGRATRLNEYVRPFRSEGICERAHATFSRSTSTVACAGRSPPRSSSTLPHGSMTTEWP